MGSKSGYADALLGLAGLAPGQGAKHYLWCEPDPGCRLLLEAYRDAALARAAADIIRGWAGEDPRALWERLRAEGPPRGPEASPGGQVFAHEVARWGLLSAWAYRSGHPESGPGGDNRWSDTPWRDQSGAVVATRVGTSAASVAGRYDETPKLPATITPDARQVDPREVARAIITGQWAYRRMEPASGWCSVRVPRDDEPIMEGDRKPARNIAADVGALDTLPATILSDAHAADPGPALPAGTVALFDPPYQGTTPYAHDLPRADVVAIARRWAAAGALVMVCEQEPIPELLADGWVYRDIAHARKGQARTFSRQSREVVTMNRAPVHVPAEQVGLFGGAR
jgi:hypothetical protein